MKTLHRELSVFSEIATYNALTQKGYKVDEIVKDLFSLFFDNLQDMNTPLREYVFFHQKLDTTEKRIIFNKPSLFVEDEIKKGSVNVTFMGSLKKYASGVDIANYIKDIIGGYVLNEKTLLELFKLKTRDISKNAEKFGIHVNPDRIPLLNGFYHTHKLKLSEQGDVYSLNCNSLLTIFL